MKGRSDSWGDVTGDQLIAHYGIDDAGGGGTPKAAWSSRRSPPAVKRDESADASWWPDCAACSMAERCTRRAQAQKEGK